jgi:hypothetical protein
VEDTSLYPSGLFRVCNGPILVSVSPPRVPLNRVLWLPAAPFHHFCACLMIRYVYPFPGHPSRYHLQLRSHFRKRTSSFEYLTYPLRWFIISRFRILGFISGQIVASVQYIVIKQTHQMNLTSSRRTSAAEVRVITKEGRWQART